MSTKFEQLLDYLVNEDHEKANELFHEIVVEKSREIYENLIAEEDMEDDVDESMELEDSFGMDDDEETGDDTGDSTDDFGGEISDDGENFDAPADDEHGHEDQEDSAIMDIKNAIEELEAAFAELEQAQGGEADDMDMDGESEMDMDGEADDMDMDDEDEGMYMEGRRITREYVEKVGHDYGKAQKTDGDYAGAGTGEQQSKPVMGKSPISSGKGKPTTGATAENIATRHDHDNQDGAKPHGKAGGFLKNAQDMSTGNGNVPGGKMGVKNLAKVAGGHGAEKKGAGPGPVGSGTGDKAGQTNIDPATKRQFLPQNK